MIVRLYNTETFDIWHIFLPGGGYYYRPLLALSFVADKYLWGLSPSFMHLENILLHLVNALLVFLLARRLFSRVAADQPFLPLVAALLFAMHPINTEPVNWISGRTDPLAAVFVLGSALALTAGLEKGNRYLVLVSSLLLFLGAMSKEIAIFFAPAACVIILIWPGGSTLRLSWRERFKELGVFAAPIFFVGIGYLLTRLTAFGLADKGIGKLTGLGLNDEVVEMLFRGFGFYVKKLFLPFPLNFAIRDISELYVWVGVAALATLVWLLVRLRDEFSALLVAAAILIVPALIVYVADIAWTPLAERYLYLPSAFFVIAMVGYLWRLMTVVRRQQFAVVILLILLLPAIVLTGQRNVVWQDNQTLYRDTLKKSPKFAAIYNELAGAEIRAGNEETAEKLLLEGEAIIEDGQDLLLYVNRAGLLLSQGKPDEARALLAPHCNDKQVCNSQVLRMLMRIDEKRLTTAAPEEKLVILMDLADTMEVSYRRSGDAFYLYRAGQMLVRAGRQQRAAEHFTKVYAIAPAGAYYKEAAGKMATRLRSQ
jgi:tetratricopeptide (TPR) repeat protein